MMLTLTGNQMVLHNDGLPLAGATLRPDGRWDVSTWPVPPGRDQAITALTITELLAPRALARPPTCRHIPQRTRLTTGPLLASDRQRQPHTVNIHRTGDIVLRTCRVCAARR